MWIVRLALRRPYTFVVLALLIAVLGVLSILTMTVDIFPRINIPVVNVIWNYGEPGATRSRDSLAAIELVLAQPAISSQLIDNLNASIHLRALLTDLFLIDEILRTQNTLGARKMHTRKEVRS
jgi:hypothetical protein